MLLCLFLSFLTFVSQTSFAFNVHDSYKIMAGGFLYSTSIREVTAFSLRNSIKIPRSYSITMFTDRVIDDLDAYLSNYLTTTPFYSDMQQRHGFYDQPIDLETFLGIMQTTTIQDEQNILTDSPPPPSMLHLFDDLADINSPFNDLEDHLSTSMQNLQWDLSSMCQINTDDLGVSHINGIIQNIPIDQFTQLDHCPYGFYLSNYPFYVGAMMWITDKLVSHWLRKNRRW